MRMESCNIVRRRLWVKRLAISWREDYEDEGLHVSVRRLWLRVVSI